MSVARTARRRRKQAAMGYKGLVQIFGPKAAPRYKKRDTDTLAKRQARLLEKQRQMQQRSKKK